MPSATIKYGDHSATMSWPDGTSQDAMQSDAQQAYQAMQQHYGPLSTGGPPNTSDSLSTAFRNGAGDLVSGIGHAGTALDQAIQNHAPSWLAKGLGATYDLQNGVDQAVVDRGNSIHGDTQYQADPLNSVGNVAHDAAGLVAGAAPSVLAAAISGPAAPLVLGTSGAGNTLYNRMQEKGESSPSAGDIIAAAGSGILNAVGGKAALGLGKIPGLGALGQNAESAVLRALGRTATSAAAGAAVGGGNYVADTAGTGQMTGQGALDATGQGAATGAILAPALDAARGAASSTRQGLRNVGDNITASQFGPMTDTQAASVARVNNGVKAFNEPTALRPNAPPTQQFNGYAKTLGASVGSLAVDIASGLSPADAQRLRAITSAAAVHNATPDPRDLGWISSLPVDPSKTAALTQGLTDLDTVSQARMMNRQSGPFAQLGSKVGGFLTSAALLTHSPMDAAANLVLGHNVENRIGGAIGGGVDKLLGLQQPVISALARKAAAQTAGQDIGGNTLDTVRGAISPPQDDASSQAALGVRQANNRLASVLRQYGPDDPRGKAALEQLQASGGHSLATQAISVFNQMGPIRIANAKLAQAQAANKSETSAQDAQGSGDARRSAQAFAITPAEALANRLAGRNEAILQADDAGGHAPDANASLTAQNATANQIGKMARGVRKAGGEVVDAETPDEAPAPSATVSAPSTPQAPSAPATGGPRGLATYLAHEALEGPSGVSLSPDDLMAGLHSADSSGLVSPDQFAHYQDLIQNDKPGSVDSRAMQRYSAILDHAIALRTGGTPTGQDILLHGINGTGSAPGTTVRDSVKYAHGVEQKQSTYSDAVTSLKGEGMPDAAQAVMDARHVSDPGNRAAIFDQLPAVQKARVNQLLGAKLYGKTP